MSQFNYIPYNGSLANESSKHNIITQNLEHTWNTSVDDTITRVVANNAGLRGIESSFDPPYSAMRLWVVERISTGGLLNPGVTDDDIVGLFYQARDALKFGLQQHEINNIVDPPVLITKSYAEYWVPIISTGLTYLILDKKNFSKNISVSASTFVGISIVLDELKNFNFDIPLTANPKLNLLLTSLTGGLIAAVGVLIAFKDPIDGVYYTLALIIAAGLALIIYGIKVAIGGVITGFDDTVKTLLTAPYGEAAKDLPGQILNGLETIVGIKPGFWYGDHSFIKSIGNLF